MTNRIHVRQRTRIGRDNRMETMTNVDNAGIRLLSIRTRLLNIRVVLISLFGSCTNTQARQ